MALSTKNYVIFAQTFGEGLGLATVTPEFLDEFMVVLEEDNPNFNRSKFLAAVKKVEQEVNQ